MEAKLEQLGLGRRRNLAQIYGKTKYWIVVIDTSEIRIFSIRELAGVLELLSDIVV